MSRRPARRLILASLLLAAGVGATRTPLGAQEGRPLEPRRTLSELGDSAHLRLLAPGVFVQDGLFLGLENDSVRVADADALLRVGVDEIEGLSVRGSRWRSVSLQSAAVGVVAGAMAGFFLGTKSCGDVLAGCDRHALGVSLRWGAVFGGVGAILGGAVGSKLETWRDVFP
jgi:hypothetical protein